MNNLNPSEGTIARGRRRARELGEECLALAERETEQLIKDLGRDPSAMERILVEQIAGLAVRVRQLRKWGKHSDADQTTRLLLVALDKFHIQSKRPMTREKESLNPAAPPLDA